ncbi:MAG TPA: trehalose-phosphatase [Candidatus Limnocylindrales bacterium]|nr:trehalose-phosphatase [Candidatus Limnocylindrales bacterium]
MAESSQRADTPLSRAIELARGALGEAPAGLLTDFDGTISPIVNDPAAARLVAGADRALAALAERLAVVAVITGRTPLDARRMTGVPAILIAGNHGMEWLEPGESEPTTAAGAADVADRLEEVLRRIPELPGVVPEHKGISASVHYRQAPDPEAARTSIVAALRDVEDRGLRINHGHMIVEVRPVGLGDKGSAARAVVERFGLRGVVVLGDDATDLDMFRAIDELRSAGRLHGAIIGVGGAAGEVLPALVEACDVVLADPAEVAALLVALSR